MNSLDTLRSELRHLQALDFVARLRHELAITPDDPELHWALHELQPELARRGTSWRASPGPRRRSPQARHWQSGGRLKR